MEKVVKKAVKTGYGLGILTLVEAKKISAKVKKELKLNEKESLKLAKELVATSEKVSKDVLGKAQKHFESNLIKAGLTDKKELALVKKIVKKRIKKKICGGCKSKPSLKSKLKKTVRKKKVVKKKLNKRKK